MIKKIVAVILAIGFANAEPSSARANELFFKVCEAYQSGQYRDCKALDSIEFKPLQFIVLHIYSELIWKPGVPRTQSDIFMRWLHRAPNGDVTPIVGHTTRRAYRWRPSEQSQITRWHVQVTVWQDRPGSYVFEAYTDPSATGDTLVKKIVVPVKTGPES